MSVECNAVAYSERSKHKLVYNGFRFVFDKTSKDQKTNFWRCDHKSRGCKARMHAVSGTNEFIRLMNEHNHESKIEKSDEIVIQAEELPKMDEDQDNVGESISLLANAIVKIQNENQQSVKKRKRSESPSTSQINEMELIDKIPDEYKFFSPNEKFLLASTSSNNSHQILIFGRESNSSWIAQMKQIFIHSYKSQKLPQPFTSLCLIWAERLASRGLQTFPILYVFLENKSHSSYAKMFEMIKQFWPQFDPDLLNLELNKPLIDVAYEQFKEAAILGCFDNMKSQMQHFLKGKLDEYTLKNNQFALNCRMITSLAFLPQNKIEQAFNELTAYLSSDKTYSLVLQWFKEYFIGKQTRNNHKRPPLFAPEIWSCHQRILNSDTLSNKNVSIAQKQLEDELNDNQNLTSICKSIHCIRELQNFFDLQMKHFLAGESIESEFDDQHDCQQRLARHLNEFDEKSNLIDFLFAVAQELGAE